MRVIRSKCEKKEVFCCWAETYRRVGGACFLLLSRLLVPLLRSMLYGNSRNSGPFSVFIRFSLFFSTPPFVVVQTDVREKMICLRALTLKTTCLYFFYAIIAVFFRSWARSSQMDFFSFLPIRPRAYRIFLNYYLAQKYRHKKSINSFNK